MQNFAKNMKNDKSGFSLVELAIVLVIIGILVSITVNVGSAQLEITRIKTTQDKLDKIQGAITLFLKTNNYIPCPAAPGGTGLTFGVSAGTTTCTASGVIADSATPTVYIGVIPNRTLGLPDDYMYDAWNNRITYVVSKNCIDSTKWSTLYPSANNYACSTGTATADGDAITIKDRTSPTPASWPNPVAFVVISHGRDGVGAWTRAGAKTTGSSANSTYEKQNGNLVSGTGAANGATGGNTYYFDGSSINDGGTPITNTLYFDDIVRWRTALQLNYDANH